MHKTVAFHPIGETLEAEPFYTKCGFTRLSDPKEDDETVLMFFDLKSWSER